MIILALSRNGQVVYSLGDISSLHCNGQVVCSPSGSGPW